jgi:hypothetical protein
MRTKSETKVAKNKSVGTEVRKEMLTQTGQGYGVILRFPSCQLHTFSTSLVSLIDCLIILQHLKQLARHWIEVREVDSSHSNMSALNPAL